VFDIRWIRENGQAFDDGLKKRGLLPMSADILAIDERRRALQTRMQEAQARRNAASKEIGKAKSKKDGALAETLMTEVADLKGVIQDCEQEERSLGTAIANTLAGIPNLPLADVPVGADADGNVQVRAWGKPAKLAFEARQHFDIGEGLGLMDFETAAKLSGARFVVLKGALARMERALAQFMLDLHTSEFGYEETAPPYLVRDDAMFGTAQLPKFAEDQYKTENGMWLIPTAEVPLTNLVREQILDEALLPIRVTAYSPCFRMEAGSAGKDVRGMLRQHQFSKVELVSITKAEDSLAEHERMTKCAETVLQRLELPYRVMLLCSGDMGFASQRTYDIEVWLPGQATYREISSCSVCGDFQARRMNARYRPKDGKDVRFVHTLNGSGLAVGRTLIAVLENYQQADGSVKVPKALRRYMGGLESIAPAAKA
jgi:seryl-tRNA synthetase